MISATKLQVIARKTARTISTGAPETVQLSMLRKALERNFNVRISSDDLRVAQLAFKNERERMLNAARSSRRIV